MVSDFLQGVFSLANAISKTQNFSLPLRQELQTFLKSVTQLIGCSIFESRKIVGDVQSISLFFFQFGKKVNMTGRPE